MQSIAFDSSLSFEDALARAAHECGIDREYWDIFGKHHHASSDVQRRILQAFGWDTSSFDDIESERLRRFQLRFALPVPPTLVIGESHRFIPVSLSAQCSSFACEVVLEDGRTLHFSADPRSLQLVAQTKLKESDYRVYHWPLPPDIPLGYHSLTVTPQAEAPACAGLIVCPDRAYLPEDLAAGGRTAGFNIALYGLRSDRNWGCGDFTDLCGLLEWASRAVGFSFVGLNPLHALHNRVPYNTSPYLPLSIFYKNLIYVDVERVPEFSASPCARQLAATARVQAEITRLRNSEFVEYNDVACLKRRFLKLCFRHFLRTRDRNPERALAFADYCRQESDLLQKFALYSALDETLHKQDPKRWVWGDWPVEFRTPDTEASRHFAATHSRSVDFYKYVQFVIEEQLAAAQNCAKEIGMSIGLYHDLAVATDSCGSDLWSHRNFYIQGCRVGAPPDDFSPDGQDWAFPPPNKYAHRDSGYVLYRESIRKIVRHGGALRLDHVMRLFRLFWIPEGVGASQGTYVRDNASDLMHILALESVRSRNIIIGEDLGTVTDEMRQMFSAFGILSYRLFYFEKHHPGKAFKRTYEYERQALVSSTTHDLPTFAGFWSGRDIEARRSAGLIDAHAQWSQMEDRRHEKQRMLDTLHAEHLLPSTYARDAQHVPDVDGDLHNAVIGFLAKVQSMILLLNQEDFTREEYQQNLPGSTAQYPNWQRKIKIKIEDLRSTKAEPFSAMFRHQLASNGRVSA